MFIVTLFDFVRSKRILVTDLRGSNMGSVFLEVGKFFTQFNSFLMVRTFTFFMTILSILFR